MISLQIKFVMSRWFVPGVLALILKASLSTALASVPLVQGYKLDLGSIPLIENLRADLNSAQSLPLTMALKFVEFFREDGKPILSKDSVKELVARINPYFQSCRIRFQMEAYRALDSASYGLSFKVQSSEDMKVFRKPFDDSRYLVVINTQNWDHEKMGSANAWTAMPGESPSGVVMEAPVASYPGLVAHELGHYLSLNHVSNVKNLMNPIIYGTSTFFTAEQCLQMRKTALEVRPSAIREGGSNGPAV
ncbi:MAG: zinc-dependent metalloprotease family protein [Bdellovibrionia bacterium]